MPGADAAGSNRRVEIDNTLRMYQYHAKPLRVSIASVVYGVGDSEMMLIAGRTDQRSAMARHRLLVVVALRAVIILVGLGGSASAQRSDAVGEAWSTTSNVILFVAMAVALVGLGKLNDAYFNWFEGNYAPLAVSHHITGRLRIVPAHRGTRCMVRLPFN